MTYVLVSHAHRGGGVYLATPQIRFFDVGEHIGWAAAAFVEFVRLIEALARSTRSTAIRRTTA